MKAYDVVHGWLYKCVGGPMDGMDIRMTAGKHMPPTELPVGVFHLTRDTTGVYELVRPDIDRKVKYGGTLFDVWEYSWEPL